MYSGPPNSPSFAARAPQGRVGRCVDIAHWFSPFEEVGILLGSSRSLTSNVPEEPTQRSLAPEQGQMAPNRLKMAHNG